MYKVQVNKERLRNHMQYDWWKYIVGIMITMFLWSMITTITAPKTPPEQLIEIFLVGDYTLDEAIEPIKDDILNEFTNLLEVNILNIPIGVDPQMDYVGRQKLMVMVGSQSGDIYAFEKEEFKQMAEQGAFMPLDEYVDDFKGILGDVDLEEYKMTDPDEGVAHYYGIPLADSEIFKDTGYDVSDKVIGVMAYSGNQLNAIDVVKWILNSDSNNN